MICPNCGSNISDYSSFCTECGCTLYNQPVYDNGLTDYEDPIGTENANLYVKKAKSSLILSIIAIVMGPALPIICGILGAIPILGWIMIPVAGVLGFIGGPASLICLIISLVFVHNAINIPEVIAGTINPELFGKYIAAQKNIKAARVMNKIYVAIICIVVALVVLAGIVIGGLIALGVIGVPALVNNF